MGRTLREIPVLFNGGGVAYALPHMRVILMHGFNASPEMNFHPWLAAELRARGFEVLTPRLNLKLGADIGLPQILEELRTQVGPLSGDDILLGHSLGGLMLLQYLEAAEMDAPPRAAILVASPWHVGNPALRHLFIADFDAEVLMWKAREFFVIHSKEDALVSVDHGHKWAAVLKATFIETAGDGHYMDAQYPILLKTIEEIAARPHEFAPGKSLKDEFASQDAPALEQGFL